MDKFSSFMEFLLFRCPGTPVVELWYYIPAVLLSYIEMERPSFIMRVCLLNDSFPPVIDGVANTVLNYAEILSRDLHNPVIVATPRYPGVDYSGYPFEVAAYSSLNTTAITSGYRAGNPLSAKELAEFMGSLGCQVAYNLDGGGTATLVFPKAKDGKLSYEKKDALYNKVGGSERQVSDIIYFATAVDPESWK